MENGGPRFKEQVETWGAVFEKKQRWVACSPYDAFWNRV